MIAMMQFALVSCARVGTCATTWCESSTGPDRWLPHSLHVELQ
jgi:hypothetical protein